MNQKLAAQSSKLKLLRSVCIFTRAFDIRSNAADDIAKYIDATSSGNTNALPIGKKFTRQNTRDLTGMIAANANTSSNEKDEYNPKIQMMHRQESFARDLEQQQRRASIFKKQGSLKGFVS